LIIAYLTSLSSDKRYKLENKQKYLFGRNPFSNDQEEKMDNELKIYRMLDADDSVSRSHLEIHVDINGNIKIIDKSRYGTYLLRFNNPIVKVKKFEEIKVFDNDILILGGLEYELKLEYDKSKCKICKKEIPSISLFCPVCGSRYDHTDKYSENIQVETYIEDNEFEDDIIENTITETTLPRESFKKYKHQEKDKKRQKLINEIECKNCGDTYLDISANSFCLQCGQQNCNKRVYLPCIHDIYDIPFRDKFARCPITECSKINPQTREESKNGRPPHNMCKDNIDACLDSGNNLNVLEILIDAYKEEIPLDLQNKKKDDKYRKDAVYQKMILKSRNRDEIRNELSQRGIEIGTNGIKHICDNLWSLGLISDVYLAGSDPSKVLEDSRTRVFYIITSDKERFNRKINEEIKNSQEKLKTLEEKKNKIENILKDSNYL
jgi:FHA domain-containing protein